MSRFRNTKVNHEITYHTTPAIKQNYPPFSPYHLLCLPSILSRLIETRPRFIPIISQRHRRSSLRILPTIRSRNILPPLPWSTAQFEIWLISVSRRSRIGLGGLIGRSSFLAFFGGEFREGVRSAAFCEGEGWEVLTVGHPCE